MSTEKADKSTLDRSRIQHMLSHIPPPSALKEGQEKKTRERRLRISYNDSVKPGYAKIHPSLAQSLGITDRLEIVVTGKDPLVLKVLLDESLESTKVYLNPEEARNQGIADNSIATVRASRSS